MKPASLVRPTKQILKGGWHKAFLLFERLGIHVTPVHFYSGLPNLRHLKEHRGQWMGRSELPGIKMDPDEQIEALASICQPFQEEYQGLSIYWEAVEKHGGPGYGQIESQALHGFVRYFKPRRLVEVGSGLSTHCLLYALGLNKTPFDLTCIDPYPNDALKRLQGVTLVQKPVQEVPQDVFQSLAAGDLLFIDSSHVVQVGSDVNYLILEVLPRLAPGVVVTFHDICLPYDYPRDFLSTILFPLETSLLRAFLTNNPKIEITACLSQLHYDRPEELRAIFPDYQARSNHEGLADGRGEGLHFPSSLWMITRE